MIIDAHAHLGTIGQFHCTADDLVRWADRAGIDRMITSDLDAIFYDTRAGNRRLAAAIKAHPDRIMGYASFTSAYFGQAVLDELDRCADDYGMRGLKIYSSRTRSVAEPDLFPIVARAAERSWPILAHADAREIGILARAVPQATFIIAHLGEGFTDTNMWQTLTMARACPNVILDLTSSQIYAGMVERCVETVGPERVVFGTDVPLLEPEVQIQKVFSAQVDERTRRLILGDNAARLFHLNTPTAAAGATSHQEVAR